MKRVAFAFGFMIASASALAQQSDPALDGLDARPPAPSELDALSEGENTDFPDIETVEKRRPLSATLRALNKITAKYVDIEIAMNETAAYGALEITPRFCDKRPPEEFPETTAFVEIVDKGAKRLPDLKVQVEKKSRRKEKSEETPADPAAAPIVAEAAAASEEKLPENMIFSGWMFASSPALNGLEHPVYDVWVIDCKTVKVDK
jgi:hypothetical protein